MEINQTLLKVKEVFSKLKQKVEMSQCRKEVVIAVIVGFVLGLVIGG